MSTTTPRHVPNRREFLAAAGLTSGAVMLAGCGGGGSGGSGGSGDGGGAAAGKGSSIQPLAKPAKFQESPAVQSMVESGSLPTIEERIPEEPYVIPHKWVQPGTWGGMLKMNITNTSGGDASPVGQFFYSHSMLRSLNDGKDVGPGLVTKWAADADASTWTFTLRKGLKWSDGHPVTTADVVFWWENMANDADYTPESVPDEGKSGKGTICKLAAKDDLTFTMTFDAPAPLTADRLAMWTSGPGGNGPTWIVPAHFVKQYHPKYSKVPATWAGTGGLWEQKCSYKRNPACPTLTPFKLTKYNDARSLTWERNPYAYEVMPNGDHLPYIDGLVMTAVKDPQVGKVQIISGRVDFVYGPFNSIILSDVSSLTKNKKKADIELLLWDSGDGTGSVFFASQDYYEKPYRDLFAEPKFRRALSLAFNRAEAKKAIYFEQGELTTGTLSPKAKEYSVNDEGKATYASWRDSFSRFDPAKAKSLLDGLGLKDTNGDGYREFADGSKLTLRIDRPADASDEHIAKDAQLKRDWQAIGINLTINPVPPTSFDDNWKSGKYMCHSNWGVGDGPNHLLYPQWLVPMEFSRWAPLQGQMYNSKGTKFYTSEADVDPWKRKPPRVMPEKGGPIEKLWTLYDSTKVEPDEMKRTRTVWEMIKLHVQNGPYYQGVVANYPVVMVKRTGLKNVPTRENLATNGYAGPWIHPAPAVYDPQTFYWDKPDQHTT